jgi:anti-sigma regulatory factor (Ser/Thr protein kinase)
MDPRFARLTLPARLESVETFREFVRRGAEAAGLESRDMNQLDLVLEEILVNIARYAYQPETGEAEVAYAVEKPGVLLVEISDKGRVFNPLELDPPDLTADLEDRRTGGLGVFLVKRLVGSMAYRRDQGRNTVSFRFPGPDKPGPDRSA